MESQPIEITQLSSGKILTAIVAMWRSALDFFLGESFGRAASVLVGGTAAAQLIAMSALPLLTRIYGPSDFSVLAVYVSLVSIISVVSCLRLDIAIPIPERDEDGAQLLASALLICAAIAVLVGGVVLVWPEPITEGLGQPGLQPYLSLVPLGVWMTSSFSALQYWSSRRKRFSTLARTRVVQTGTGIGGQLLMGASGLAPFGLLFGHALYSGAGMLCLARQAWRNDRRALEAVNGRDMKRLLHECRQFPRYSTLEALANSAAIELPIILIAALAAGADVGFLMLAVRMIGAPMQLVGGAVTQVYLARAPEEMRARRLRSFTFGIVKGLAKLGVAPLILSGIIAPAAFALAFGEQWRRSGVLVQWMTPWVILQFLASPISMALHIIGRQDWACALQVGGLMLRVGAVLLASVTCAEFEAEAYAISGGMFYAIYLLIIYIALLDSD